MKSSISTIALATAIMASAPAFSETLNWNYAQAGYTHTETDTGLGIENVEKLNLNGFQLKASAALSENVFVTADYALTNDDVISKLANQPNNDIDFAHGSVGVGYQYGDGETAAIYAIASYEYTEVDNENRADAQKSNKDENEGFGLTFGLRSMMTPSLEIDANIAYIELESDSDTAYSFATHYYFTDHIALGVNYTSFGDLDTVGATLRYAF